MPMTNGQKKTFKTPLITISVKANSNGRYVVRTAPVGEINPSGVFQLTEKQLNNLASQYGLNDWKSLAAVTSNNGCELIGSAEFCQQGEKSPDDESVVYTKDWWKVDVTSIFIELSDTATRRLDNLIMATSVKREEEADKVDRAAASRLRMAIMGDVSIENGNGTDDDDELELEDETPEPTKKRASSKK